MRSGFSTEMWNMSAIAMKGSANSFLFLFPRLRQTYWELEYYLVSWRLLLCTPIGILRVQYHDRNKTVVGRGHIQLSPVSKCVCI